MLKFALPTVLIVLPANLAFADDLPFFMAPGGQPTVSAPWTGFYAGLNAGYLGSSNGAATNAVPLLDGPAKAPLSLFNLPNFREIASVNTSALQAGLPAVANTGVAGLSQSGFIGGGQIGYNWQATERLVLGVEADIQRVSGGGRGSYSGASSDGFSPGDISESERRDTYDGKEHMQYASWLALRNPALRRTSLGFGQISSNMSWLGTVRGRVGYLLTPSLMSYGTGGARLWGR